MLATQFQKTNHDFVVMVEKCSAEDWNKVPKGEKRSVGVIAHHVGQGLAATFGLVQTLVNGQPIPLTPEMLDQMNAQAAVKSLGVTKATVLEALRSNGATVEGGMRKMTDAQLDQAGALFGGPVTAQAMIERVVIGHPQEHMASIQSVMKATA
jgi:hypothetical protein